MSSSRLTGVAVLVVDDNLDALDMVKCVLDEERAEVRIASAGAEAMTLLDSWTPHIVLLDIAMPNEDGCSLLKRIRARPRTSEVPAIALTGMARPTDRVVTFRAGFNRHIAKPIDPESLVEAIRLLIVRRATDSVAR